MKRLWALLILASCAQREPLPPEPPPPPAAPPQESPAQFLESATQWTADGLDFMAIYQHPAAWLQDMTLISPTGREWLAWQIVNDYSYKSEPRVSFGIGLGTGVGRNPRVSVGTGIVFTQPPGTEVLRGILARFRIPDMEERAGWKLRATFVSPYGSFATVFPIQSTPKPSATPERPHQTTNAYVEGTGKFQMTYDSSKDETTVVLGSGSIKVVSRYTGQTHEFTRTTRPMTIRITGPTINVE